MRIPASEVRSRRFLVAAISSAAAAALAYVFLREGLAWFEAVVLALGNVLPCTVLSWLVWQDDYAMVHARRRRYLVSLRIRDLEARLSNPPFLRVHRSHIVNLDHVDRMVGLEDARYEVRMKDGSVVPVSRARSQEIRRQSR